MADPDGRDVLGEAVRDWGALTGDRQALDSLFTFAYEELRGLAARMQRDEPRATVSPTALVNEAWLKLAASRGITASSYLHFKRIAARAMRQILVEAARRRNARKRGGGDAILVTFDEELETADASADDLLALDAALEDLARISPRQAAVVESRFFAGLDTTATARLLGVSDATIERDWRAARAWLSLELRRSR